MLQLNNLSPAPGAVKKNKRVGRGPGSGHGKTSTKGTKGHSSRSGKGTHNGFEGGQMRLYRRLPKRGFNNRNRIVNDVVNLEDLKRIDAKNEITVDLLRAVGLVHGPDPRVKILGDGEVTAAYVIKVHGVSAGARAKLEAMGGKIEIIPHARVWAEE